MKINNFKDKEIKINIENMNEDIYNSLKLD